MRRSVLSLLGGIALSLVLATGTLATAGHRTVQMLDACDGPSFNAAIGAGACSRPGGVSFEALIGQLVALGDAPSWRFSPSQLSIGAGGTIDAVNRGGEFHTFTEVAAFGGGCVPDLNELLGLSPVPECANPALFGTTGAAPGGTVQTGPLAPGRHLFMCLIHPWMRSTVDAD